MVRLRDGKLQVTVHGLEDEVAAVAAAGRARPGAVLVGVDRVARAGVRCVDTQGDGVVRVVLDRVVEDLDVILHVQLLVAAQRRAIGLGGGDVHIRRRVKDALGQHNRRAAVVGIQVAGHDRRYGGVLRLDLEVEGQVAVVMLRPGAVVALHRRAVGDLGFVDRAAVGERDRLDDLAVGREGDGKAGELRRDAVARHEGLIAHALGLARVADAVDAGLRLVDEVVIGRAAIFVDLARDGADAVAGAVEIHERVAAADVHAVTGDAADVVAAGQLALGKAVAHGALRLADNAADIVARRALGRAVALAAADDAQIRVAADGADAVLARGGIAVVFAVEQHALGEVLGRQRGVLDDIGVALGIEIVLDVHRAGNAADIHVAVDLAVVVAVIDLAVGRARELFLRDVLDDVLLVLAQGELEDIAQAHHDDVELVVDRLHVADDLGAVGGRLHAQAGQAGRNAAEIVEHLLHRGAVIAADVGQVERIVAGEVFRDLVEVTHAGREVAARGFEGVERVFERGTHVIHAGVAGGVLGEVVQIDDLRHRGDVAGDRADRFGSVAHALEQGVALRLIGAEVVGIVLVAVLVGHLLPVVRAAGDQVIGAGAVGVVHDLHEPGAVIHGRVELVGRDAQVLGRVLEGRLVGLGHLIDDVEIVKALVEVIDRFVKRHGRRGKLRDRGGEHFLRRVDADEHFVDGRDRVVHVVRGALGHIARALRGAGRAVAQHADRGGQRRRRSARMVEQGVHQIMERVELLGHGADRAGLHIERDERLHLAADAADVLAAGGRAPVRAAGDEAALASDDAADVVADVLKADAAPVRAADDDAGREAADAADVRGGVGLFRRVVVLVVRCGRERQGVEILRAANGLAGVDVHARGVRAVGDGADVLPDDAADVMVALDEAFGLAVIDHAAAFVRARDAADVVLAGNRAVERAAGDRAVVRADDGTDLVEGAGGVDVAGDLQITDRTDRLHITEQAHMGRIARELQPADRVALPLERAAEGRDRHKVRPAQVHIVVQIDRLALRVRVELAAFAQLHEIVRRVDVDLRGVRLGSRAAQQAQSRHEHQRKQTTHIMSFHRNPPHRADPPPAQSAPEPPPSAHFRYRSMR